MNDETPIRLDRDDAPDSGAAARLPLTLTARRVQEARLLRRAFAYHPHVKVIPLGGDAPDEYQIDYRLRTVVINEQEQLEYADVTSVHVWLGPAFPKEPPLVRPISPLFHPNISAEGIHVARTWAGPGSSLVDVVSAVGAMLAYQDYDPYAVSNETAMDWVNANPQILPLDGGADTSPNAGGSPLERLTRFGPRTLEQVRAQVKQASDGLMSADGQDATAHLDTFARQTRAALALFLDEDVPEALRSQAKDLDQWLDGLTRSDGPWDGIRRRRVAAASAFAVAQQLADLRRSLAHEAAAIEALVREEAGESMLPAEVLRRLPAAAKLQMHQANLGSQIGRAEPLVRQGAEAVRLLGAAKAMEVPAGDAGGYGQRLAAESARAAELVIEARQKVSDTLAELEPVLAGARQRHGALGSVLAWREYADLIDKSQAMIKRVMGWGPAGVQAYYVENDSGRFGPFELEQPVQMGKWNLAVRAPVAGSMDIVDADDGRVLVRADATAVKIGIPDAETGVKFATVFWLSGSCEELALQLDYLVREAGQIFSRLANLVELKGSWLGRCGGILNAPEARKQLGGDLELARRRMAALRTDLLSARVYKERLATLRLLQRAEALVPRLRERQARARKEHDEATARLAVIVAGSNRDIETDQLRIPAKWASEYPKQLARRDQARGEQDEVEARLAAVADDVRWRVLNPETLGLSDRPLLTLLGAIPSGWNDADAQMQDAAMAARLSALERLLGVELMPEGFGAQVAVAGAQEEPQTPEHAEAEASGVSLEDAPAEAAGVEADGPPPMLTPTADSGPFFVDDTQVAGPDAGDDFVVMDDGTPPADEAGK